MKVFFNNRFYRKKIYGKIIFMIEYKLIRSNRKTLCLSVKDGVVTVKAPLFSPETEIDSFVQSHILWINKRLNENIITPLNKDISPTEEKRLRKEAEVYLKERLDHYANIMGLKYTGLKITSAQHRYGSCSPKNSICFSFRLMLYPREAIDYVVVHELAHIKIKNHGKSFYALVKKYMPDYKQREKILKSYKEN